MHFSQNSAARQVQSFTSRPLLAWHMVPGPDLLTSKISVPFKLSVPFVRFEVWESYIQKHIPVGHWGLAQYNELVRCTVAHAGNDHRLGAQEAPPAIISLQPGGILSREIGQIGKGWKHLAVHAFQQETRDPIPALRIFDMFFADVLKIC